MLRLSGIKSLDALLELLSEFGLELAGLAGGTLEQRIEFCGGVPPKDVFFYLDNWNESEYAPRLDQGYMLVLHPHVFMQIHRMKNAEPLLGKYPKLKFCPDTAHLYMVGDNAWDAIKRFPSQVHAIHLKDWQPQFGRYSQRYARGFVELGEGVVFKGRESMPALLPPQLEWLVVEVDSTRTTTWETVRDCARWLHRRDLSQQPPMELSANTRKETSGYKADKSHEVISAQKKLEFRTRLAAAGLKNAETFCLEVAEAFKDLLTCHLVQLWTFTPSQSRLNLRASTNETSSKSTSLDCQVIPYVEQPICAEVLSKLVPRLPRPQ